MAWGGWSIQGGTSTLDQKEGGSSPQQTVGQQEVTTVNIPGVPAWVLLSLDGSSEFRPELPTVQSQGCECQFSRRSAVHLGIGFSLFHEQQYISIHTPSRCYSHFLQVLCDLGS